MKVNIWSPYFKIGGLEGYLEKSNVDVPDDMKIGDKLSFFNKYVCIIEDISISSGKVEVQLKVMDIDSTN